MVIGHIHPVVEHRDVPGQGDLAGQPIAHQPVAAPVQIDNAPRRPTQRRHNILDGIDEANILYNRLRPRH